jgi:hypothetical protein
MEECFLKTCIQGFVISSSLTGRDKAVNVPYLQNASLLFQILSAGIGFM